MTDRDDLDELDFDGPPPRPESADAENILDRLIEVVESAKSMPLSSSAIIAREDVLSLLEAAREALPEELRRARFLLREREEFLTKARHDASELLEEARVQAERMVQRTEIVRQAEQKARRLVDEAEADARRLRLEAEDFVDHKLGAFEIVLDRTLKTVKAGRERLAAIPYAPSEHAPEPTGEKADDGEGLFDQDLQ